MIRFVNALRDRGCMRRFRALYREAFPADEQVPLWLLRLRSRTPVCDMLGVYADDAFCGLAVNVLCEDMVYVFFLAVERDLRGRGLGTAILAEIAQQHPGKRLMLCIEDPDAPCDNLPQRLRRKAFYGRCGYRDTGVKVVESGVPYALLSTSPVSWADYERLMTAMLGRRLFRRMHKHTP